MSLLERFYGEDDADEVIFRNEKAPRRIVFEVVNLRKESDGRLIQWLPDQFAARVRAHINV